MSESNNKTSFINPKQIAAYVSLIIILAGAFGAVSQNQVSVSLNQISELTDHIDQLERNITSLQNQLDQPVGSTLSASRKTASFVVSFATNFGVPAATLVVQSGVNGSMIKLGSSATNYTYVAEKAINAAAAINGSVYFCEGNYAGMTIPDIPLGVSVTIDSGAYGYTLSAVYGTLTDYSASVFYTDGQTDEAPYSYLIYPKTVGATTTHYAKASNGSILWSSLNCSQVWENAKATFNVNQNTKVNFVGSFRSTTTTGLIFKLPSNVTVDLTQSDFVMPDNAADDMFGIVQGGATNIWMYGGALDGNAANQEPQGSAFSNPIQFTLAQNFTVENMQVNHGYEYGVSIRNSTFGLLKNINLIDGGGDDCIEIIHSSSHIDVVECTSIGHIGRFSERGTADFEVEDNSTYINIIRCKGLIGGKAGVIINDPGDDQLVCHDVTVQDSYFEDKTERGISVSGSLEVANHVPYNIKLINNVAIRCAYAGLFANASRISVIGGTYNYNLNDGIQLKNNQEASIVGANIKYNLYHGINLLGSNYTTVDSCNIYDNSQHTAGNSDGIQITDNGAVLSYYNIISNNQIHDDQATKTQGRAINEKLNSNHNIFTDNSVSGNKWGAIAKVGTSSIWSGNNGFVTENRIILNNATCVNGIEGAHGLTTTANMGFSYSINCTSGLPVSVIGWSTTSTTIKFYLAGLSEATATTMYVDVWVK